MHKRVLLLIILLLGTLITALQAEAVQFESPVVKSPAGPTLSASETVMDQPTTLQNTKYSYQPSSLNIEVVSDVYSGKDRQILCCPNDNYLVVRNRIYLEGADLDKIKEVKYFLHETFDRPEGVIGDPNNDFEIWIWSWGGFLIRAVITTKTGEVFEKDFDFSFKSKFEEAQSKGVPQIFRCYE